MCGIFCVISSSNISNEIIRYSKHIQNRGPDDSKSLFVNDNCFIEFFRLKINDLSDSGNQPFIVDNIYVICNGEIYNSDILKSEFDYDLFKSSSDCEVIIFLYKRYGFETTLRMLDGVFSLIIYDDNTKNVNIARDPFGVRPLFIGINNNQQFTFASEVKCIEPSSFVTQFPPASYLIMNTEDISYSTPKRYFNLPHCENLLSFVENASNIKISFEQAVLKRLMSDRPVGCLLSGGLDSSLVASIISREFNILGKTLNTFSIGFKDSPDLTFAQTVADYIGSNHHSIIVTKDDFLNAIPSVIKTIESYDTTTVRASVGNYLVAKYIKENTDITVVYNGDGSDEVAGGYLYLHNAPSDTDFDNECKKLLSEIHYFDVLRSDRSVSTHWSLESRTPFLDKQFVNTYLNCPVKYRRPDPTSSFISRKIEKGLLRYAFKDSNLLPHNVLWRKKEAFSDGVSDSSNSWHNIIKTFVDSIISDEEFLNNSFDFNKPLLKESYYYRKLFEEFYPAKSNIIPHFWLPKWSSSIDPSAREL